LTPVNISHGKGLEFVPGIVDKASTHLGRIRQEVRKTKLTAANDKNWNCLGLEEQLDEVDLEESQKIGDNEDKKEINMLARPYLISAGIDDGIKYIHTMNPYMGKLLSTSEFIQTDITFNVTAEFPYLFNAVAFDYDILEWVIVGQVHLSHQNCSAHVLAFSKIFTKCGKDYPQFQLGKSLLGIITDWSDAEVNELKKIAGDSVGTQLLKGCRVHWNYSWHRVRDRVVNGTDKIKEKQIFNKIAVKITECHGIDALSCFRVLCSQSSAKILLGTIKALSLEEAEFVDKHCNWSGASKWAEWWIRPQHLKMLHKDFTEMDYDTWIRCPTTTNAVERKTLTARHLYLSL